MERCEGEFVIEKAKEREFVAKEMQSRLQLEKELAEECQKVLKLNVRLKPDVWKGNLEIKHQNCQQSRTPITVKPLVV